jgi:hypothetical protein
LPPTGSATTYSKIAANTSATVVFSVQQVATTLDTWSVSSANARFGAQVSPVQS